MAVINIKINGKNISKEIADNTLYADFLRDGSSSYRNTCGL